MLSVLSGRKILFNIVTWLIKISKSLRGTEKERNIYEDKRELIKYWWALEGIKYSKAQNSLYIQINTLEIKQNKNYFLVVQRFKNVSHKLICEEKNQIRE